MTTRQQVIKQYEKKGKKATEEQIKNALKRSEVKSRVISATAASPVHKSVKPEPLSAEQQVDLEKAKLDAKRDGTEAKLRISLERQHQQEKLIDGLLTIKNTPIEPFRIEPKVSSGNSTATAFMIASDWHNEELVKSGSVTGQNEYNLEIFHDRAVRFFKGGQRLWDIMRRDQHVPTIVLALLGDFITGNIHPDSAETNQLLPTDAIKNARLHIAAGIDLLLNDTDADIVVPCHTGNHGRATAQQRIAAEQGFSYELMMYQTLAEKYEDNPRVKFLIAEGYHQTIPIVGEGKNEGNEFLIRFHHGHHINYGGGVGGITIPVLKKIANWNTQPDMRGVNLDVFGHFHQYVNYGSFVCNGSLIGYNAYANSIGATYERPQQAFFCVSHKEMAKTMSTPIFVD